MKTSQLMLGDLVMVSGETRKIDSISMDVAHLYGDCDLVWMMEDAIEPIPLTAEILDANGFGRDPLYYEHNDGYDFFLGDVRSVHVGPLQYVHELQHALRLCGLNEIADNFKIK